MYLLRKFIICFFLLFSFSSFASEYPYKPITLLVGYPPGGAADQAARVIADKLSKKLNQPIIIENKPGAGATIASGLLAKANPDGYTLGIGTANTFGVDQYLFGVKYTPDDFEFISQLTAAPLILVVNNDVEANSVGDLKDLIKSNPEDFNFSSSGIGGSPHIAGLMLANEVDEDILHIPFKGGAESMSAVVSGDIKFSFGTAGSVLPLGRAQRYKMLGVTSSTTSPIVPELPSLNESGLPGFEYEFWFGLLGPKGLSKDVADKLHLATTEALQDPELKVILLRDGNIATASPSRAEFERFARSRGDMALKRIKETGIKVY